MKKKCLIVLFAIAFMCGVIGLANATPIITDGLIAAYEFNGNTNDTSGNNLHAIAIGPTLVSDRFGNENRAYNFDGNDYMDINDNNLLDFTDGLSILLWANQYVAGGRLVDKTTSSINDGYNFDTFADNNHTMRLTGGKKNTVATTSYSLNEDHHLAVTFEGGISNFYLDGVWDGSGNHLSLLSTNNLSLRLGMAHPGGYFFKGVMDDVYIYNRALTSSEINSIYTGTNPVPEPATMLLLGTGLAGFIGTKLRKKKK